MINWLWNKLPDKCQINGCMSHGVRGNENRITINGNETIVCDYCEASLKWLPKDALKPNLVPFGLQFKTCSFATDVLTVLFVLALIPTVITGNLVFAVITAALYLAFAASCAITVIASRRYSAFYQKDMQKRINQLNDDAAAHDMIVKERVKQMGGRVDH